MSSISPSPSAPLTSASISTERKTSWTGSTPSKNPLALRLYKVLSTNFDDASTREALQTLSDLYGTPVPSKGKEPQSNDVEDEVDELEGDPAHAPLSSLSEDVPGESAARARRNLRRDMENKLAEGSRHFVTALGEVDQKLLELQAHVRAMQASCTEAENQLRSTNQDSKAVLERAGSLREEKLVVEEKKSIINLFLSRFTLSEEEAEAMTSRDVSVGQRFFEAMDKTERIREDCRVLMAGEDGPTKAGLDIMASTSGYLEQGFEKILRWTSNEFRLIGRDVHLEVSPIMCESVLRLRKRPELLTETLTILSETRQATLLSAFITALTRGGPSGLPRPIELHAHDPLRYVGDMLAWVHQAIAAEREFLESLFGMKSDGRMVGSVRNFGPQGEEEDWVRELMDLAVGKLCVPLKVRVQQTIRSQESSIVSYKIANLLQFYLMTMRRTIGPHALLTTTLHEITDVAYKVFYDSIQAQSSALLRVPLNFDDISLTPPLALLDHAQILREVMNVYSSSLLDEEDEGDRNSSTSFGKVLDAVVDPVVESSMTKSAEKMRARPRWDGKVYVINCLTYIQSVLEPFSAFTSGKQQMIQKVVEEKVAELTNDHFANLMKDAGLLDVYTTCRSPPTDEPLSRFTQTQPQALRNALHAFAQWLSSPEVVHSERLSHLSVQKLHTRVHRAALARVVRAYEMICEEVGKEKNRYEAAATLLGSERPFGRGYLLRQIFGMEEGEGDEDEENENENENDEQEEEEEEEEESEDEEDEEGDNESGEEDGEEDEDNDEDEDEDEDKRKVVPITPDSNRKR